MSEETRGPLQAVREINEIIDQFDSEELITLLTCLSLQIVGRMRMYRKTRKENNDGKPDQLQ